MSTAAPQPVALAPRLARRPPAAALAAARPRQWAKNLLLFAGLLFAGKLGDPQRWLEATAAFCAYCAVSSAAYLVNDVRDAAQDRLHPVKRLRPVASGDLSVRAALVLAGCLAAVGLGLGAALGLPALALLAAFALAQAAYTIWLKRLVLVDVVAISGFFVLRAVAGAGAVRVHISPWLLVCTALLALFLALAKRRGELVLVRAGRAPGRAALSGYSFRALDALVRAAAAAAVGAYTLYTLTAHDSRAMLATLPFVVLGLARYLHLVRRHDAGEQPEHVLLTDGPILACVAAWALSAALILTT